MDIWQEFKKSAKELYIELSDEQIEQFKKYCDFLIEYNSHTNLIAKSDEETIIKRHFLDSLAIGKIKTQIGWEHSRKLIDIGIGGGFPSVPIIIANPKWKLTAIDSVGKKTKFLEELSQKLNIKDRISVINSRVEEISRHHMEGYDLALARAVSDMPVLLEYTIPFLKRNGFLIAYKAKDIDEEMKRSNKALSILGAKVKDIITYKSEDIERKLVFIGKTKKTPFQYPRETGIPKKRPLV